MTSEEKSLLEDIIGGLTIPEEFGLTECDEFKHCGDLVKTITMRHPEISIKNGMSKMVLIHPALSFVIKIPFNGQWYKTGETTYVFEHFVYAGAISPDTNPDDYCKDEIDWYTYICNEYPEVAHYFAVPTPYTTCGKFTIYLQQRVIQAYNSDIFPSESSMASASEHNGISDYVDSPEWLNWLGVAIDYFGMKNVDALSEFLNENSEIAGDLHSRNFGYTAAGGFPIFLDYCGFRD